VRRAEAEVALATAELRDAQKAELDARSGSTTEKPAG
jgi:hypothetical protein